MPFANIKVPQAALSKAKEEIVQHVIPGPFRAKN